MADNLDSTTENRYEQGSQAVAPVVVRGGGEVDPMGPSE
jgi:hypothetical protein